MVANVMNFPMTDRLIRREDADPKEFPQFKAGAVPVNSARWSQTGTPYVATIEPFTSPLGMPCNQPPYAEIAAIDLNTRQMLWRQPLGTARDTGPFNVATGLPFTLGTPSLGGTMITRSGLVFIAATQERTLRAFDLSTGRLLWESRLPTSGHANPMTYRSPRSGRQYLLVSASGHPRFGNTPSDRLIAYALPRE